MPDNNKKTFESIFTKTRVYLVIIGIVLIILCLQNILFIAPSIILYGLLLGYTFFLRLYFKNNILKVELGVCRGKKNYDKRETIKERDIKRNLEKTLKNRY